MNWNPRELIDPREHGDPFSTVDSGIELLLKLAREKGYSAQVNGSVSIDGVTRFAVSQVTQHHDLSTISFKLLLYKDKRRSSVSTTLVDALEQLFSQAERGLESSPPNDFDMGLPSPRDGGDGDLSTKPWSVEERADALIAAVNAAEEVDPEVITAGTLSSSTSYVRIVSTEGVDVETAMTSKYFKINAITGPPDARGYGQEETNWRFQEPDFEKFAREAAQTARDTLSLKTFEPGEYEVLLGPRAVTDLMNFVQFGTDATGFHEGTSYTADRLGDQIFDEKISIEDLPRDPTQANICRLYDGEGTPTQNRKLFDRGVLTFIPYDSFSAAKYLGDKNMSSGNAFEGPFGSAFVASAVLKPGEKSLQEQISEIEDGLYIKSFWYNRFTNRREGGLTGLTRNGLYHVKDGEITGAVRNLRYTESFVRALEPGNVVSVGNEPRMFMVNTVPSLHLRRYRFSSVAHTM